MLTVLNRPTESRLLRAVSTISPVRVWPTLTSAMYSTVLASVLVLSMTLISTMRSPIPLRVSLDAPGTLTLSSDWPLGMRTSLTEDAAGSGPPGRGGVRVGPAGIGRGCFGVFSGAFGGGACAGGALGGGGATAVPASGGPGAAAGGTGACVGGAGGGVGGGFFGSGSVIIELFGSSGSSARAGAARPAVTQSTSRL